MNASFAISATVKEVAASAPQRRDRPNPDTADDEATQITPAISEANGAAEACGAAAFAQEQIRGLIRRVFFPGWPKASRQVVISSVDAKADTAAICARIAREMAAGLPGTVCVVEADRQCPGVPDRLLETRPKPVERGPAACIRVEKNLWLAEPDSVFSSENDGFDPVWLRTRLSELRRNFDYGLIHAPAAFLTDTIVLAQLVDGLILAIQEGKTHRAVAQATLMALKAAKVAVLGTVFMDRTFPIPPRIYQRL